ncbi:MAG TPA: response regulator [Candidatus Didemnitutus sp.]|nr:response regulator [Candidatus Didemnitutus sp.]
MNPLTTAEANIFHPEEVVGPAQSNPPFKADKKRILVVDDRARDTGLVKLCLERTNDYIVREENDAKSAVATAESFEPDLILLDIMMPGMDGGTVAACFQQSPKLHGVPIVFLTGLVTQTEVDAGGGHLGDYPFLAKPITQSELIACIKHQLG